MYEKSCGISGAIECLQDVCDPNAPEGYPSEIEYVLKGWPIRQCVVNTVDNDCDPGWYETDLKCKQCSAHCGTCVDSKYFCTTCVDTNNDLFVTNTAAHSNTQPYNIPPVCFDKTELARLCLCDHGITSSFNDNYMILTVRVPSTTHIDWNYYLDNEDAIKNDRTIKDKAVLGQIMKRQYDTIELENAVS